EEATSTPTRHINKVAEQRVTLSTVPGARRSSRASSVTIAMNEPAASTVAAGQRSKKGSRRSKGTTMTRYRQNSQIHPAQNSSRKGRSDRPFLPVARSWTGDADDDRRLQGGRTTRSQSAIDGM